MVLENVSMPSTGFYLFLPLRGRSGSCIQKTCQCPQRASTYFFYVHEINVMAFKDCVNALNGLLLISSVLLMHMIAVTPTVSMPSTGFYLFLLSLDGWKTLKAIVSMPSTGFYLFLQVFRLGKNHSYLLCQCPQRASTYFFWLTTNQ